MAHRARGSAHPDKSLRFGVGLRREHFDGIADRLDEVDFLEFLPENFMRFGGRPSRVLREVAARVLVLPAVAQAQTYRFNVPSKLVNIAFESRMDVEDILGTTHSVSGFVKRSASGKITFSIKVPVAKLRTGIAMRDKHLRGAMWLSAARHPYIVFSGTRAKKLRKGLYRVWGKLILRGVSRPLSVDLRVRRIPASVAVRVGLGKGDWLRVRGRFAVSLSAHGIKIPRMAATKVNDRWTVKVSLFEGPGLDAQRGPEPTAFADRKAERRQAVAGQDAVLRGLAGHCRPVSGRLARRGAGDVPETSSGPPRPFPRLPRCRQRL